MQTTTTLLLAALTGSALANNWRAHPALKRDLEQLQARATDSASSGDLTNISPECQSAVLEVIGSIPTPAPKIAAEEMKNPQTGNPCEFTTPSALKSEYAEYSSEVMSWFSESESQIMHAYSACSEIADRASDFINVCTTDLPGAGKASSDAKETGSSSVEKSSSDAAEETASATDSASGSQETPSGDDEEKDDEDSAAGRLAVGGLAVVAAAAAALL